MSNPKDPRWLHITQDPDALARILDNQAHDLSYQAEQELRKRELETTHEYSLRLLDAEFLDRQREREHQRSTSFNASMFVAFLTLLLVSAICYGLYLNKDQLVIEFLKAVLFIVTGGVGGYSLKTVREKSETPKP